MWIYGLVSGLSQNEFRLSHGEQDGVMRKIKILVAKRKKKEKKKIKEVVPVQERQDSFSRPLSGVCTNLWGKKTGTIKPKQ